MIDDAELCSDRSGECSSASRSRVGLDRAEQRLGVAEDALE